MAPAQATRVPHRRRPSALGRRRCIRPREFGTRSRSGRPGAPVRRDLLRRHRSAVLLGRHGLPLHARPAVRGRRRDRSPSGVDRALGGGVGYNITRNWGVELQFQGVDPDLRSASRGTIREISVITIVPAVRYRWPSARRTLRPLRHRRRRHVVHRRQRGRQALRAGGRRAARPSSARCRPGSTTSCRRTSRSASRAAT